MMKDLQHVKIPGSKFDVEILEFRDNPAERFWIKVAFRRRQTSFSFIGTGTPKSLALKLPSRMAISISPHR